MIKLDLGKKTGFIISGEITPEVINLPGARYRPLDKVVRVPSNRTYWKFIREIPFDHISDRARQELDRIKEEYRKHRLAIRKAEREFKIKGNSSIPVPLKTTPFSHQVRAFGFCSSLEHSALFMDQGTGKTLVAIALMGFWAQSKSVKRVVVVCPKSVKPVWKRELKKHSAFKYSLAYDQAPARSPGLEIYLTNYDRVKREARKIKNFKADLMVFDESHKIKNRKSDRYKACKMISGKAKHRLILTGTPLSKCISEVWAQFNVLDSRIFGSNYSMFKQRYLKMGGYMGYSVVGYQNEDEYSDKLHSIAFRVKKEECLDLPGISYLRYYVKPDSKSLRVYKDLELDMYAEIEGSEVTADSTITQQMKFRQITGGMVKADDETLLPVSNQKLELVKEILEERRGDKTVIFFSFTHEIRLVRDWCEKSGIGYLELSGSVPQEEREIFEDKFQEDPQYEVALIQVQTGAEGLTLTASDFEIFYSPSFSWILFAQARDRLDRIGQERLVKCTFLIMEGTVDETIASVLESNSQLVDLYLEQKRNYRNQEGETLMSKYTAAQLAEELDITPAELRKHLRSVGAKKPAGGWSWESKKDAAEVKKAVQSRIKELEAGGGKAAPKKAGKKSEPKAEKKAPAKKAGKKDAAEGKAPVKKKAAKKKAATRRKDQEGEESSTSE